MSTLRQILRVIRLVGPAKAVRMKRRHEQGLAPIRGYTATRCFWVLLECGLWDEAQRQGAVDIDAFAARRGLKAEVLHAIARYLDGIGWVRLEGRMLRPAGTVQTLLAEPRGLYELGYAYEPVMDALGDLLAGRARYGRDVVRRTDWVGMGSGRLCGQLPYPVLGDLVAQYGGRHVLDLGCGDGALLIWLSQHVGDLQAVGLDLDAPTVELARRQIAEAGLADRARVIHGDMFDLVRQDGGGRLDAADLGPIDTITACDTFHEYLWDGEQTIVEFLRALKARWTGLTIVMGDFCVQSHEWLRRHPIASLEHHLWHDLTGQRLIREADWRRIFEQARMVVAEARVFDLIGHGYFVLR